MDIKKIVGTIVVPPLPFYISNKCVRESRMTWNQPNTLLNEIDLI